MTESTTKKDHNILIECKNLSKTFYTGGVETHALRDASCKIYRGEFVSIMGPSGSGKSTFMHLLSFLEEPTGGTYHFDEKDALSFDGPTLAKLRNQEIGFVFQAFNLLPRLSVWDNVELPLLYDFYTKALGRSKEHKKRIENALESVGLSHRKDYKAQYLSGGEKQRVAIARALVNSPKIIFADEPTGNLDSKAGLQVMRILQDLSEKGHTIIMVTHENSTAMHASRILRLKDGVLVGDEEVKDRLFAKDATELK